MADTKISDEGAASALVGNELIPGVQSGGNVKITPSQIKTFVKTGLVKSDVGLGSVDNTPDASKPVSTAQATADALVLTTAQAYTDSSIATEVTNRNAAISTAVVGLLDDRGNYDASGNTFPLSGGSGSAGAILKGDLWTISVAGTLGGHAVTPGDVVRALVDTPGSTDSNWAIGENNFGYVALNQALADGKFYVGNSSGIGTAVTPTGDVTFTNAGVFAIGANKVVTSNILDANVTLAKMANVATATVFYRKTSGTGVPEIQTLATLKTDLGLTGTNSGDQTITLTGQATGSGTGSFTVTLDNASVIGKVLTGYTSGAGTLSATDTILSAIQKLDGNDAGKWSLASGGTLTGANTITGTTTNILKAVFAGLGTTQTNGAGLWLANTTAATSGNQQISPLITLEGQGWETTGGTSQSFKVGIDVLPVQNTSSAGTIRFRSSANAGAYADFFTVTNGGVLTLNIAGGSQVARFNGQGLPQFQLGTSANGISAITNAAGATLATAFGLNYTAAGGTTGTVNALHNFVGSASNITSWSATYRLLRLLNNGTITPTSGAGGWTNIEIVPTYNVTSTATGTIIGLDYNPTETAMTGITHYGILQRSTTALSGFGIAAPTALVHIGASTTARASLCIPHGTAPTSPVNGDMWTDTSGAYIRINGVTKTFTLV